MPRTNDTITATAVGSDGQNDPLTYTYDVEGEGRTQQTTSNVASTTDTFDLFDIELTGTAASRSP